MPYDPIFIQPFRDELTSAGVEELLTSQSVNDAFENNKNTTMLVVVNSVCGCAAGCARPAIVHSLQNAIKPKKAVSVFAGQDFEATAKARELFGPIPPSSPSMALYKNGEMVHFIPRHRIEGRTATDIANELQFIYEKFCS
ncbi:MAG: BrxA/BrxB family bacilliredoxin [Bacteroidota bacterium]